MEEKIMNPETAAMENQMMQFILGKWISKPVHVAATLGIPDLLAGKDRKIEDIAEMTHTCPSALYRMMRALSCVGIFAETENRKFTNTPLSECLMEDRLRPAAMMFHSHWHDRMWDNLMYSIQTGKPAFEKVFSLSAFDWLGQHPEEAEVFHKANAYKAAFSHGVIVDSYDFTGIRTLTDVGGGTGSLMIEILKANPHMKGTVAELPENADLISAAIRKSGLGQRMNAVACDFFNEIPVTCDACLLSNILHDWPDEKCITILENCRKVLNNVGKIIILEAVIPPGNDFSISKLLDLEVFLMGGGCERNKDEFENLMKQSGFRLSRILNTERNISIIEGVPASGPGKN